MNFTGMLGAHKMRIWLLCSALKSKCNTSNITQSFEFCFSLMPFDVKLNWLLAISFNIANCTMKLKLGCMSGQPKYNYKMRLA